MKTMNGKVWGKMLAVVLGVFGVWGIWFWVNEQSVVPRETAIAPTPTQIQAPTVAPTQMSAPLSVVDWKNVAFDACGGSAQYEKMPWWKQFSAQIEKIPYYSTGYIQYQLRASENNEYLNPTKKKHTYESYCADTNYSDSTICGEGKNKKLAMSDFQEGGEGCLAKDESAFIALFPGEYMGGGKFIVRYDIKGDILEVAKRMQESERDQFFSVPPREFGKRTGMIIKMTGRGGDAGCGGSAEYEYDLVANTISLVKSCSGCGNPSEWKECKVY